MRRLLGVLGIGCAIFVCSVDLSIVNTVNPVIQKELGASIAQLQWILNAYAIGFAVLLVTAGRFGDFFGRRRVMTLGLTLFGLASLACGLAPTASFLIGARAVQGVGGSIVFPLSMALAVHAYPAEHKARAIGLVSLVVSFAMALGPVLGGVIAQFLSWRWVFFLNLPIIAASIPLVYAGLSESRDESHAHPIDWWGVVLLVAVLLCLVMGIIEGPNFGWSSGATIGLLVGAAVAFGLLIWVESQAVDPIIPFRLFANPIFFGCSLANFGMIFFWWTTMFLVPLYLFNIRDLAPSLVGLTMLFLAIPVGISSFIVPRVTERTGPKAPMLFAFALMLAAGLIQAFVGAGTAYAWIAVALVLVGVGTATVWTPSTAYAIATLPKRMVGAASGSLATVQEMGGSIGLAISITLFRAVANSRVTDSLANLGITLTRAQRVAVASTLSEPKTADVTAIGHLTKSELFTLFEGGFVDGYQAAMWLIAGIALLAGLVVFFLIPRGRISTAHAED